MSQRPDVQPQRLLRLASDVYKAAVYDPSENKIGDVDDLIIDKNRRNRDHRRRRVPWRWPERCRDSLHGAKISMRDGKDWLVLNRTKDELKAAPAFDKKAEEKM